MSTEDEYRITVVSGADIGTQDLAACVALVSEGDAVDSGYVAENLPRATAVSIARRGGAIMGVAALKRVRRHYASSVAEHSQAAFDELTPELGYVSVAPAHRGRGLSRRLIEPLLGHTEGCFATTSSTAMETTLTRFGFVRAGESWKGRRGDDLSLFLRRAAPPGDLQRD